MELIKVKGFVIKTIDYDESSKIVYLFSEYGIISVLAKGAKKYKNKKLSFLELYNHVECISTDSSLSILKDYSIIDNYEDIKSDLKKTLWLSYMFEIISKLPKDIPYKRTYEFLVKLFEKAKTNDLEICAMLMQTKFLPLFGVKPEFNKCVVCQNKDIISFSIPRGGMVCSKHKESDTNFFDIKKLYYFNIDDDFSLINNINKREVFENISSYYAYHVEIYIKSTASLLF